MRFPLANDQNGNPIDVPPNAVGWRVRRGGGRRGRPRIVFDNETGRQLEVPLEATIDDLIDHGCPAGRYRLDAFDAEGKVIDGVVGITEISEEALEADEPMQTSSSTARLLQTVERQTDTICRALEAMAQAFGPVRPAQVPVLVTDGGGSMKPEDLVQTVAGVGKLVADMMKGGGNGGGTGGASS